MSDINVDVTPPTGDTPPPATPEVVDAATTTADSAPAPTDGDEPTPADGDEPAKAPASVQKSINRLTRQRAEAERRATRAEIELEVLRRAATTPTGTPPPKSAELKQSDFATYDDFIRAQARQEARDAVKEEMSAAEREHSARRSAEAGQQKAQSFVNEATAQAKTAGIDFEDAWETLTSAPRLSPAVAEYLFDAEHKASLADYLAKNPDELARISDLSPRAADRELAKVEVRLSTKPAPKRSSAPPPPPTLGGGGVAPSSIERMPYQDVRKLVAGWSKK